MAYAALISLKNTVKCLPISTFFPVQEELGNVSLNIQFLHQYFESDWSWKRTRENADDVERRIADVIYRLEDVLESFTSIENVKQKISCFLETVRNLKMEVIVGDIDYGPKDQLTATDNEKNMIVGFEDEILELKDRLISSSSRLSILPVVGMQGIGKTTLVKQLYKDPDISYHFDVSGFVTIGPRYRLRKILLDILVQNHGSLVYTWDGKNNNQLMELIYKTLKSRRFLLVLDDVWKLEMWNELKICIPDDNIGSRIVITTTQSEIATYVNLYDGPYVVRFMSPSESWALLQKVVFTEDEPCPLELESLGMKIARNSQGLPIEIIWVGSLLSKSEKTVEFWKEVVENYDSYITAYDDEMSVSKKLYASYENLPPHLKACFLYMGVFPRNYAIPASKLVDLWVSEGFLEPNLHESLEQMAKKCLQDLVDRSIVMVHEQSSTGEIKACRVHHLFWHLCVNKAGKINFFNVINGHSNVFPEATDFHRRLCIRKNIVLAIKDVHQLMGTVSKVRSLLCMAENHQYPLPVCFEFKQLRVLDVLSIRFYNFPPAILKLIQLRYLALTFNGELPASISVLGRLQILIVRPHIRIRSCRSNTSFLPVDMWKMKELRHLYIIGSDLPNPFAEDQLSSLQILSGVSPQSCTMDVLKGLCQLKKLGIRIELPMSDDAAEPICPFGHLFLVRQLESFKCVVVNPNFGAQIIKLPDSNPVLSHSIRKISLSGCGLPWDDMKKISLLPHLTVLKLREHAFTGAVWEISKAEFHSLRLLLLESMDLVSWITNQSLPCIKSLILKHCYQLNEIPSELGDAPSLELIELFNCSRSASDSVKQIAEEQMGFGNYELQVRVTSSM